MEAVNAEVHNEEAKIKVEKDTKARARKEMNTTPVVQNRACSTKKEIQSLQFQKEHTIKRRRLLNDKLKQPLRQRKKTRK